MAGKGSRKSQKASKKGPIDVETFAFDVLSHILQLCGFPTEKIKKKERKQNAYSDNFVVRSAALILNMALSSRDEWKIMFESRLKNSGLDTPEKIYKYLKSLLAISNLFQNGDTETKMHVSLAAYSEIMLFLNYKGVEFDFEQMLTLWSRCFMELIVQDQNLDELLKSIFILITDPTQFTKWITTFVEDVATPYGSRDDVSEVLSWRLARRKRPGEEKDLELAETIAKLMPQRNKDAEEPATVLPPGFESSAVLPGDRDSPPEPPETCDSSVRPKDKKSRSRSSRSAGVSNPGFEERPRSKTTSELELEERLGQMNLNSEDSPKKNKRKRKKPKDRQSY